MAKNGEPYIVAKRGLELKAVILPIYQGEQLLEELETLTKELSASISRRKMMEQVDPGTGEVVEQVDPETGEVVEQVDPETGEVVEDD